MKKSAPKEIVERVEAAKKAIEDAERDLAAVLAAFDSGQRAEKRHMGEPLGNALGRLRVAQSELATLKDLLTE